VIVIIKRSYLKEVDFKCRNGENVQNNTKKEAIGRTWKYGLLLSD
jgi:hypothetical protein